MANNNYKPNSNNANPNQVALPFKKSDYITLSPDMDMRKAKYYAILDFIASCQLSIGTIRSLLVDPKINSQIDMSALVKYQNLDIPFIEEYYDILPKENIYLFQKVNVKFIEKHIDDIIKSYSDKNNNYFSLICQYQKVPLSFLGKYHKYIEWHDAFRNMDIKFTIKFLCKYMNEFTERDYSELIYISNISDIFNELVLHIDDEDIPKLKWSYISWNIPLNEDIIEKYIDYIDFNSCLLKNRTFNNDFITCYRSLKYNFQ